MTTPLSASTARPERAGLALLLVLRTAFGLVRHGLRHPLRPATICRLTGKVTTR